jgi:flagellin-like hook-associated protein FlgL
MMSIFEIGQNKALSGYDRTGKAMDTLAQQLTTGKKINVSKDDPVIWAKSQQDSIAFKGLQRVNDDLSYVATSVRNADAAMGTINEYVEQMKAQLDAIIKNYPPYPSGSQERVRFLRMFNGLRTQIDQLSAPPGDMGGRQIMADPSVAAGDWTVPVGTDGASVTIRKQEVHTGATGLNIPTLADTATDAEIAAARENLDTAQATLANRRAGLGTDAASVIRSQDYNTSISTVQKTDAEMWTIADMNEVGAEYKSMELKNALALQSTVNLTNMQSQLMELLK